MTIPFPLSSRKIKNPARLMQQGVWLMLIVAVSLLLILRRSGTLGGGSLWILGLAVVAFLGTLAMRDVMRRLGHRNTEDKLVKDVKAFLETQPPIEFRQRAYVAPPASRAQSHDEEQDLVPRPATNFVASRELAHRAPGDDLVVFDAMQPRVCVELRVELYPVLAPVVAN
ncbi:MAG: hypothetical protein ABSH50_05190 [Bryobacteraceae bacterium]